MHMRVNGSDCQLRMILKYDFPCLSDSTANKNHSIQELVQ